MKKMLLTVLLLAAPLAMMGQGRRAAPSIRSAAPGHIQRGRPALRPPAYRNGGYRYRGGFSFGFGYASPYYYPRYGYYGYGYVAPPPCGYYDQWGYWHYTQGCYYYGPAW